MLIYKLSFGKTWSNFSPRVVELFLAMLSSVWHWRGWTIPGSSSSSSPSIYHSWNDKHSYVLMYAAFSVRNIFVAEFLTHQDTARKMKNIWGSLMNDFDLRGLGMSDILWTFSSFLAVFKRLNTYRIYSNSLRKVIGCAVLCAKFKHNFLKTKKNAKLTVWQL